MRILSIGLPNSSLVDPTSATAERHRAYYSGWKADIIVLACGAPRVIELGSALRVHVPGGLTKVHAFWRGLRLARALASGGVDVVTAQDPLWCGSVAFFVARRVGARLHLQDHSGIMARPSFGLVELLLRPWARWLLRRAARVRTVSERGRRGLLAIGVDPQRIDTIPIATDITRYADLAEPTFDAPRVLCVARLEKEKGIDLLLIAWKEVFSRFPAARLRIVGDGRERSKLEEFSSSLSLRDSVEFVGQREDVRADFAWSNLYVQPSRFEGWGMAVIEAAASGRPILMTDVGCAGEVIVDGISGIVVPAEDPSALARAIIHLMQNVDLAVSFGRAARVRASILPDPMAATRKIRESFERCATRAPSILVMTQMVNIDDPALGFFHRWLELLAGHVDRLTIICLFEGRHALPKNVEVLSLGKERGASRLIEVLRFYRYIFSRRRAYDGVFIHMNPIYVVLGGLPWKLLGKRLLLWYVHKSVEWKLRIAEKFVDGIFTASKESFRLPSRKVRIVGHGIDTDIFSPASAKPAIESDSKQNLYLLTVGRISSSKDLKTLIDAVAALLALGITATLDIAGAPVSTDDVAYAAELRRMVAERHLTDNIRFLGPKRSVELPELYRSHHLFLHASRTGSIDKVVLEALACGLPVYSSSEAFARGFEELVATYPAGDASALARQIAHDVRSGKIRYTADAVAFIRRAYDLRALIQKISEYFA